MRETKWKNTKSRHYEIMRMISDYNFRIAQGDYIEYCDALDIGIYLRLLSAHVINFLVDDESLYLPNELFQIFAEHDIPIMGFVEWEVSEYGRSIRLEGDTDKDALIKRLIAVCFDEQGKHFIQEICAQDIVDSGDLAKKIRSFLNSLYLDIESSIIGEEELIRRFSEAMRLGRRMVKETQILLKYDFEYRNRGALIQNRVLRHQHTGRKITASVALTNGGDELLDYRVDKYFCQAALLHVGVESTCSSGTGFVISEDGYALTCAHVVEDAKKIYATVINGDGYPIGDREGFEVYDAGDGEVVYVNKDLDIALLKMHHYGCGFLPIEQRRILPELGEEVVVFGYPLGYEVPQSNFFGPNISFYKGYVSSNQVNNGNSVTFLDINVKSGNSGSPVISAKTGKVIGIISGIKLGGKRALAEKMPYMIPIQHFLELMK